MAKNLNVNLAFSANTSQVRVELNALKKSLNDLVSGTALKAPDFKLTKDIQEATRAAAQLKVQLDNATNPKTGNLDLTRFNESMKKSGLSLEQYQNQLYALGPAGEKAFASLAKSITLADVPLKRSSKLLDELWTTMKNTARWQLTSSAMHSFIGAIQSAYGYAQDLNESLNNIRIVSGASVEKMAQFAKEANSAAKRLSTTTTQYTNASLIFYQQGLNDNEVKERTDITIKMANAAGQSAEVIADQLTAIWNNFYDGSKSLEYYADVMTALGAATASSTDEIAGGLEKFAAIGETIGLSYEYAASALATITSNTRQSEEVVGTALKTIFARIQGLNLGETLDDGTTLNKYSKALQSVGISIFDSAGEMKKMDAILDEMATKWDVLSKAQQVALAQTVAGTRQYTQLVALMDNWDNGDNDSMTANLATSYGASGTLQNQADIQAESWEAASKRMRASIEAVYSALLNDDFFIGLTDGFANLIDGIKVFIDSLGGVKGILLAIGSIATSIFSKQITKSIGDAIYSIKGFIAPKKVLEKELETKERTNDLLIKGEKDKANTSGAQNAEIQKALGQQQKAYIENVSRMSEEEKQINQILMDQNQLLADAARQAGENVQNAEEQIALEEKSLQIAVQRAGTKNGKIGDSEALKEAIQDATQLNKVQATISAASAKVEIIKGKPIQATFEKIKKGALDAVKAISSLDDFQPNEKGFIALGEALSVTKEEAEALYMALNDASDIDGLRTALSNIETASIVSGETAIQRLRSELKAFGIEGEAADEIMENYINAVQQFGPKSTQAIEALNKLKDGVSNFSDEMNNTKAEPIELGEAFTKAVGAAMAMGQAFTTVKGIIDVFNDSESTTGDKIMALVSGIGMLIPTILAIAPAFSTASVGATLFGTTATAAGTAASLAMWQVTLIVAAITAIVAVVAFLVTQESAAERQARKTAETAESMKAAADEAKQSFEDLKSAFDAYDTAIEKLEACREGTEEWNEALKEVNNTVLDILQNNPELAKNANLFTRNAEGMLVIDPEERKNVLAQAERNANVMAAGAVMAQAQASQANTDLQSSDLSKEIGSRGIGNVTHTDYGPVYDQILNAGQILTNNASELAGLTETEYRAKVKTLLENASNDQAKSSRDYTAQIDNLVDQCVNYQSQINSLAQNTEEASNQMHNAALLLADQELGDSYDAASKTVAANQYDDIYQRIYDDIIESDKKNTKIDDSTSISKDIWRRYNKAMGTNLVASKNQIQGDDNNRVYAYKGKDGEETVTIEHMAATIAASEALKEMGNSAQEAANKLSEIESKIGIENADLLKGFIAEQGFEGASQENFTNFYRDIATYNPEGISTGNASKTDVAWYIDKMFGDGLDGAISNKTAMKYGYKTGQAMIDALYDQISNTNKAWESMEITGLNSFKTLSMESAIAIDDTFKRINLGPRGKAVGEEFVAGLNKMISNLDSEDQSAALEKLANVNWSSYDALEQAAAIMKDFGVEIDITSAYWIEYAESMRLAMNAMPDFTQLKNDLIAIQKILKDLTFGESISEEDYQTLIDYKAAWADFFMLQSDGTRKFIGNEEDLQKAIRDTIHISQERLSQDQANAEAIKKAGLNVAFSDEAVEKKAGGDGSDGLFRFHQGDKATTTLQGLGYTVSDNGTITNAAGQTVSKADASKVVMANSRGTMAEELLRNPEVQNALLDQGYDQKTWEAIIAEAKAGDDARLQVMLDGLETLVTQDYSQLATEYDEMLASTATSLMDLDNLSKHENFDTETEQKALIGLASAYEDCRDEVLAYQAAIDSGNPDAIVKAEKELRKALRDADWRKATKAVKGYWDEIKKLHDVDEIAEKQGEMADALNKLWGTNITSAFVRENWDLFNEWANATGDRATELALEIQSKAVLASANASDILDNTTGSIQVDIDGDGALEAFGDRWSAMKAIIEANPITIGANGKADLSALISSLMAADFTAQEVANYLASIGQTEVEISGYGTGIPAPPADVTDPAWVDWWNTYMANGPDANIKVTGASVPSSGIADMNNYKGGGGGGGGKPKTADKVKKSDVVQRYKEIDDSLDDLIDKMEDATKVADRLYGKGRLDLMKKNNELLKQEIDLTKKKKDEALKYLEEDKQALFDAAADAGVMLNIDENGLITNYTEAMTELYNELDAEIEATNKDGKASEAEQARIDKIQERIDGLQDATDQYDETRELIEDLDNDLDEKFYQWQDNNYEILTYELEIKLELNEDELKVIDYYLNKVSDDFYQMAEAAALMVSSGNSVSGVSQLEMYTGNLASYEEQMKKLEESYANGEISQAAYIEGLREIQDGMISNLESLNELDKTMMHYYGDTLDMAAEEIAKYTDRMEHQTEVLDHYQSLMEIIGKSTNYKAMGIVLEGKAKALGNQAAVAKETMQMYKDEADDRYAAYQQALIDGDQAAAELYLQQYEDALAAANEAEQEYLASAEEWAEALKAVLENKLADFGQTLENALTGGTSFDQMTAAMERAASLQEEYLTTTNKIYETNKLMRTAQQEIDKTSNTVAKRRLQNFIKETDQLQNQAKLSSYELEIQQAKYDLLLAEIALEEAQNAKSNVRLQRDSEGNFGYVYTADSEAISAAEQEMLDKQNSLYNIALEGANGYAEKYQQTLSEMYDTLTDLQTQYLEGAFESEEEYHAAVEAAKEYYYEKLQQYSSLHTIALTTDSRVVSEAWSADFNDMTGKTEEWMNAVNTYVDQVKQAFADWNVQMSEIAADTGTDLDSIEQNVKDITTENDNLKKAIIGEDGKGGVVGAIKSEIEAVKDVTEKYATLRGELGKIKTAYEEITVAINNTIKAQSQVSSNPGTSTTKYQSGIGGGYGNASDGADSGESDGGGYRGGGYRGRGGSQTTPEEKKVSITLYAAKNTKARMGTHTVKSNTSISFGQSVYDSEDRVNGQTVKMMWATGPGWHGYVTQSDRNAVRNAFGFATGGYTGDWAGAYGKLAFLHQKELVLNQGDTENFLASMEVLERILQVIDLQSTSSQIGGLLSAPGFNSNPGVLEQNVHIEANFPNVSHSEEIEEAFSNLVNLASQYAYRS